VISAISPHAPFSIEIDGYRRCAEAARRANVPIATHLAESPDEAAFLADHSGPFRRLWETIGGWDDAVPRFAGGPLRMAKEVGLLDTPRSLLAHVNYVNEEELALLAVGVSTVVYCPRTHAYFRHPRHSWLEMLKRGINVAVGTDSTASSPDLNLVQDLRLLHTIAPQVPAETIWEMATVRGASALGLSDVVGVIESGNAADLVAFPIRGSDDPLREVLESAVSPAAVWIAGQRLVR
jgi:cytosine/adenosine deaminase-related metal-dependent hydrolase